MSGRRWTTEESIVRRLFTKGEDREHVGNQGKGLPPSKSKKIGNSSVKRGIGCGGVRIKNLPKTRCGI